MNNTSPFPPAGLMPANTATADLPALAPWSQNLRLPDGTQTAPELGDFPRNRWAQVCDYLPDDLSGCTALDVGCNAGFYSIELARRGATVTAVDSDPHVLRQAQWAIAQHGLQGRVTLLQGRTYDLARCDQRFDVVLFLGLFERVRYPLLALDVAARLVKRCFVFHGCSMPGDEIENTPDDLPVEGWDAMTRAGWPKMAFIEKATAGSNRIWWAPNRACVEAMFRSTGLEVVERPADQIYICQPRALRGTDLGQNYSELVSATGVAPWGLTKFEDNSPPTAVASSAVTTSDQVASAA